MTLLLQLTRPLGRVVTAVCAIVRHFANSYASVVCLGLIILLAAGLRFWGIAFGLPFAEARPDEMIIIRQAFGYGTGDLNPHVFYYPSLFSYLVFAGYGLSAVWMLLSGSISSLSDLLGKFVRDPTWFFLVPRIISAVLGTATVGLVFLLAKRVGGLLSGLSAALILATAYLHVRDSHFGVTDVSMAALVTASLIPMFAVAESGGRRAYIWSGVLLGLAASMKYNGAIAIVALIVAHVAGTRGEALKGAAVGRLLTGVLAAILVFGLTSPFVLLDWSSALRDLTWEAGHLAGAQNVALTKGWVRHAVFTLPEGAGYVSLLLAAGGAVWMLLRRRTLGLVLLAFPLVYYLVMGSGYTVFTRHMVPIVPFISVFAGVFIGEAIHRSARERAGVALSCALSASLLVLAILSPVRRSLDLDSALARQDTRELACSYIKEKLPSGGGLGWVGTRYGLPLFPESPQSISNAIQRAEAQKSGGRLLKARLNEAGKGGWSVTIMRLDSASLEAAQDLPALILTEYYPTAYALNAGGGAELILSGKGYREVCRFGAPRQQLDVLKFDVQDSFYFPFGEAGGVERAGPTLTLWEKK